MALWQPWIAPTHMQHLGFLLGFNLRTGKKVHLFPWTMPTNSTTCQIEGEKNAGKSTFMKTVVPRALGFQARDVYGEPTLMRARLNARKSERGVSEIAPLSDALHAKVYDLNESGGINLFGLFVEETDIIEVTINVVQEVKGGYLGEKVSLAIMVAVRHMMKQMKNIASPSVLEQVLRYLTVDDFVAYHKENRANVLTQFESELKDRPTLRNQLQISNNELNVASEYVSAAIVAADCLAQLLYGNYGNVFKGNNSLYDVLSDQLTTLNWENLPSNAQTVLEAVLMKAESAAIVMSKNKQEGAKDLSKIIPHINMSDEEGGAMKSLMHARFAADRQNKSRAYPTADFRAVQYYSQVTEAGADGSEIRGLAKEIELGVGYRIIFRQPNDTDFLHRFSRLGMSDPDVEFLPQLGQGQAALWVRDQPPLFFQHVVLSTDHSVIQTNSARSSMADPTPLTENLVYNERRALAEKRAVSLVK
ncbi:MAG TPA: hypothetical protein VIM31_01460 [Candidatus Microsaccharimonas sp.]